MFAPDNSIFGVDVPNRATTTFGTRARLGRNFHGLQPSGAAAGQGRPVATLADSGHWPTVKLSHNCSHNEQTRQSRQSLVAPKMSYDPTDAARDEMYDQIGRELYPEHKAQAIGEFTAERLRSFYVENPRVMRPAVDAIQEGKQLTQNGHNSAAVVFFVTAVEILLKATLLKPVVHGLVHSEGLADIIVEQALGQPGFDRYSNLLAQLFSELADMDIRAIKREEASEKLLAECTSLQKLRNQIIHQGASCTPDRAMHALAVSVAVYDLVVCPMLFKLGLQVVEYGEIRPFGG